MELRTSCLSPVYWLHAPFHHGCAISGAHMPGLWGCHCSSPYPSVHQSSLPILWNKKMEYINKSTTILSTIYIFNRLYLSRLALVIGCYFLDFTGCFRRYVYWDNKMICWVVTVPPIVDVKKLGKFIWLFKLFLNGIFGDGVWGPFGELKMYENMVRVFKVPCKVHFAAKTRYVF